MKAICEIMVAMVTVYIFCWCTTSNISNFTLKMQKQIIDTLANTSKKRCEINKINFKNNQTIW